MIKHPVLTACVGAVSLGLIALGCAPSSPVAQTMEDQARFTDEGELIRPEGWREWVYVGAPLTPNALNGGEAAFPEFHSVYIDPESWRHWQKTGTFRDGTLIAKELSLVIDEDAHADGSTDQVSGRGFFMGAFSGFEIAYKSESRFPDAPGNWAYFTFGHHAPPYAESAPVMPEAACSACHQAAADDDLVFTQFYPVLRASDPR